MATINFIKAKIEEAEQTLKCREQMQKVWREGTNESWSKAGCLKSKAERIKESDMHGRIAAKNREEIKMFKEVLEQLESYQKLSRLGELFYENS